MMDLRFIFACFPVFIILLATGPETISARKHHELHHHVDALDSEEDHVYRRSPEATANATDNSRQIIRALLSRNALAGVVKRLTDIKSPNATQAQAEYDKLIANQKTTGLFDVIEKLKGQESNTDVEKLKVDVVLEDYGGAGKDVGKIAKQIVRIETVESQLDKVPYNMALEYLVATLKDIKPLLIKYQLWDVIMKAKESLKITTRTG